MRLPKKIEPDFLKDSIIEIRYESNLPHEFVIGLIYQKLNDLGFKFVNVPTIPLARKNVPSPDPKPININLNPIFFNDVVRVNCGPNMLVFNFKDKYPLWDNYFAAIKSVFKNIYSLGFIEKIFKIGLRYINSFENTNIFDIIRPDWRVAFPNYQNTSTTIKTEVFNDPFRTILNIGNGYPLNDGRQVSLIDIDVIYRDQRGINFDLIFSHIDKAHSTEKSFFFGDIIKEDYVKPLIVK